MSEIKKVPGLAPDTAHFISGAPEGPSPEENLRLDPTYVLTRRRRDPNEADRIRRTARASTVERAVAPAVENALAFQYRWGVPLELVRRILTLEATVAELKAAIQNKER